jgi:hypothetical protein
VQSFMDIDARDVTFVEEADGTRRAQLEVLAVMFGDNGQVADEKSRGYTITIAPDRYADALRSGFVYALQVPVKRSGPYQLRVAMRDVTGDRIGSASHFVDVPDVKKGRLTLSGLLISAAPPIANGAGDDVIDQADPRATVALRTFRQGSEAMYLCSVYNARRDPSGEPQLDSEVRLYRDGLEVFRRSRDSVEGVPDASGHPVVGGILRFRRSMPPGSYLLELGHGPTRKEGSACQTER